MQKPLLHFDAFGSVQHVLHEIEVRVPEYFPEATEDFIKNLKSLVVRYADQNNWDIVAINLSKGLARQILDDIVEIPLPHSGTIIIDPSGHTPDYQVYDQDTALKSAHERLTMVNEATQDIMVIIYGIEEMTKEVMLNLIMRRARMTGTTLDLLDDDEGMTLTNDDSTPWRTTEGKRRLVLAQRQAGLVLSALREAELGTIVDHTGNLLQTAAPAAYLSLAALLFEFAKLEDNPALYRTLAAAHGGVVNWYRDFQRYGLSLPNGVTLPPPPGVTLPKQRAAVPHNHPAPPSPEPV